MNKIINQYITSKNSLIFNIIPNKIYCFSRYWVEKVIQGKFESIIYNKGKQKINEIREFKKEVDGLINNFNSEYKNIRKEFKGIL